jgi:predicted DNA-binding protein (MmcQ/YjbR family)
VDIPFPLPVRNELVESGAAEPHHILPKSGWVSIYLRNSADVGRAIELLRRSYEIALASQTRTTQSL